MSTYEDFINNPRPARANKPEPLPRPNGGEPLFRIKPLEWDGEYTYAVARCGEFKYTVAFVANAYWWTPHDNDEDGPVGACASLEAAKAACEAHWRARIAEALEPVSVSECWSCVGPCAKPECEVCGGSGVEVKP